MPVNYIDQRDEKGINPFSGNGREFSWKDAGLMFSDPTPSEIAMAKKSNSG